MHGRLGALAAVALLLSAFAVWAKVRQPTLEPRPPLDSMPSLQQIGVIEGFYGTPWSHQDRLDMLQFMQRVGMNAYYYAPKNDPYHRDRWREGYPPGELRRLRQVVDTARVLNIAFYYSISPGLSIVYSDSTDWMTLRDKIQSVYDLGVRHFALMLDDVPPFLTHDQDVRAYTTLADAHAHLINRLDSYLQRRDADLVVTPTTYTNAWGDRDYLRRLGTAVPRRIPFFWTGTDVSSPEITAAQARAWGELIGRPPLIWDNYPVNDYARWRVFLGPLRGRTSDLATAVTGIIANPMNQARASMLPLATVASYGRDPANYHPGAAIERAALEQYGGDIARALAPFFEIYGDYGWDTNVFEQLFAPGLVVQLPAVRAALTRLEESLSMLEQRSSDSAVRRLRAELEPVVSQARGQLASLVGDSTYERRGDLLVFRSELDRVPVPHRSGIMLDGKLDDWPPSAWRRLRGRGITDDLARVALGWDADYLWLALRVQDADIRPAKRGRIGERDHVTVVIDLDPTEINHIAAEDPVILLPAPGGVTNPDPEVQSLDFRGFMAKNIAARRDLRFTEFLVTSLSVALDNRVTAVRDGLRYSARRTADGYAAELAIPRLGAARLRMTIVVTDVRRGNRRYRSLPVRNYPGNPTTFAELWFEAPRETGEP